MGGKWGQVGLKPDSISPTAGDDPAGASRDCDSQTMTPKQKAGPPMAAPLPLVAFGLLVEAAPEPIFHTAGE